MLNDEEKELYSELLGQVQAQMKVSLSGIGILLEDETFEKGFTEVMASAAKYVKVMYDAYIEAGFTPDQAILLAAATVGKGAK
jgi:hypothetical protein